MNVLAKVVYGSNLYGTSIPTSDQDYRAVYLPTLKDCVLGRARDAWEDKTEDDTSYFSFQHFLRLAGEGQSIAIEMLAAPEDKVIQSSPVWTHLHDNRRRFYTKNMKSFLGYAKSQSSKYSSRIDRLNETEQILKVLKAHLLNKPYGGDMAMYNRLSTAWDRLPESPNATKTTNERNAGTEKRVYLVCGREIQATVTIDHAYSVIKAIADSYGERVRRAKDNQLDYKALAHAFRVALQAKEIAETGDLVFPLKDAAWLRDMRLGKMDFFTDQLDKKLDDLIVETQSKMDNSDLPDKVDPTFIDSIILQAYNL